MARKLWVDAHRPQTMDEYVWQSADMRAKAEEWVADGVLPHLMFYGPPGSGKTSLARLLLTTLGIPEGDILFIPASRERKIDDIQSKIENFVNTWALNDSGVKYVLMDEFDAISPAAQKMLRTDMETYSDLTRFICTCNYEKNIIPALRSRFTEVAFGVLDEEQFLLRIYNVLTEEGVTFEVDDLLTYKSLAYPDLRKCIGLLQKNTLAGVLHPPKADERVAKDYLIEMVALFREGQFLAARKLVIQSAQPEEYGSIYRFFYENLELFGETPDQQDNALLAIRKAVVNQTLAADPEILLAACLVELTWIAQGKTL